MEKMCIMTEGVLHSFEKIKPQLCFFFKKHYLVVSFITKIENVESYIMLIFIC